MSLDLWEEQAKNHLGKWYRRSVGCISGHGDHQFDEGEDCTECGMSKLSVKLAEDIQWAGRSSKL